MRLRLRLRSIAGSINNCIARQGVQQLPDVPLRSIAGSCVRPRRSFSSDFGLERFIATKSGTLRSRGIISGRLRSIARAVSFGWAWIIYLNHHPQLDTYGIMVIISNATVSVVRAER